MTRSPPRPPGGPTSVSCAIRGRSAPRTARPGPSGAATSTSRHQSPAPAQPSSTQVRRRGDTVGHTRACRTQLRRTSVTSSPERATNVAGLLPGMLTTHRSTSRVVETCRPRPPGVRRIRVKIPKYKFGIFTSLDARSYCSYSETARRASGVAASMTGIVTARACEAAGGATVTAVSC